MKKVNYILLIAIFVLSVFIVIKNNKKIMKNDSSEISLGEAYFPGDVNGNDKIDVKDYKYIVRHIVGVMPFDDNQKKAADINGDGNITVKDYKMVVRKIIAGDVNPPSGGSTPTSNSSISLSDLGAKCDGVSDDTEAISNAFSYATTHDISEIDVGNGKCNVSRMIYLNCNTTSSNPNIRGKMTIRGNATFYHKNITFIAINPGCDVVNLENFTSVSNYNPYQRDVNGDGTVNGYDSISHVIVANENPTVKLTLSGVTLNGAVTGISVNGLDGLTIENSTFENMAYIPEYHRGGYGVLCQGCKNMTVKNSKFIAGPYYRHGLYISRSSLFPKSSNIVIDNCEFDYTGYTILSGQRWSGDSAPLFVRASDNVTISNCVFKSTVNGGIFQADADNITGLLYKDNTLYPTIRRPAGYDYHHGVFFYGGGNNLKVYGTIDNFKVINPPSGYNSYAAALYSEMHIKNNHAKDNGLDLRISNSNNTSKIIFE